MTPKDFFTALGAAAQASAKATGVPAGFTVAQAALESAWGTSGLSTSAFNLFGVKADKSWTGPTLDLPTKEYVNGAPVTVVAHWRKYANWEECLTDHARFLTGNPRYKACFPAKDSETFARGVAAAGYATDPAYADKIISIIRKYGLASLDA